MSAGEVEIKKQRKTVEILWTGGFDSTFRIVQLSRCDIYIQPYYLSDKRASESYELKAIQEITELLKENKETKCTFKPLIIVNMTERMDNKEITEAYHRVLKTDFFGSQYEWLGIFAVVHKEIELSIHQDDKAILLLRKYASLKKIEDDDIGEYFIVDNETSNDDMVRLFGNYNLPLVNITKLQMREIYLTGGIRRLWKKHGFAIHL